MQKINPKKQQQQQKKHSVTKHDKKITYQSFEQVPKFVSDKS